MFSVGNEGDSWVCPSFIKLGGGVSGSPEKAAKGDPSPDPLWDNEELN